jgi:DNA-binding NtrC family response regulator
METGNTGTGKILAVQKSAPMLKNLSFILKQNGYEVFITDNLDSAESYLQENNVKVIITGTDFFSDFFPGDNNKKYRKNLLRDIPLLLTVTAHERLILEEQEVLGETAVITKPFSADTLIKTIQDLIQDTQEEIKNV